MRMWWKKTVVYQIYPRSFKDSTGNGIGDIPGIISKLDYLRDLGIETIWFSPFFSSPQKDHGYDVSDYRNIAPEYGTLSDCEQLIKEIHNCEMHAVFDMVLNHTSDQHPWFIESRSSRDNSKRNWYIWRDGKRPGERKPPNNWNSVLGGTGWHYDDLTDQWYWAQFLPFQPDLNYRNPEVKEEMFDMLRFWLDKGVDGFRLDIIDAVYEDEQFKNNPRALRYVPSGENTKRFFYDNIYTVHHPDNFVFAKELRRLMDEYTDPERFLVGEVGASLEVLKRYCGEEVEGKKTDGLHMVFQFQSLRAKLEANVLRKLMLAYERFFSEPYIPTWVFSNHDTRRRIRGLGGSVDKAKLNALFQLTARGVPFIYQGEEIGMLGLIIPLKNAQDPVALKYSRMPRFFTFLVEKLLDVSLNRDECRTPIQWDSSANAGFCQAGTEPWLPVGLGYETTNAETASADPNSLLNCYKTLLHLRRDNAALNSGSMHLVQTRASQKLLSYERIHEDQTLQIWLNLSETPLTIEATASKQLLFSTLRDANPVQGDTIALKPLQGIITEL